ncbi:MFS transporter [Streptomyces mangrovisoli]|uniref:MFS transporter n=2 Tax=Streptomyces mangrovisoli TaxID=1428628 RepID=A0A1J4NST6_9ACTN|nr:MFS transporter [Streptomyces mangrovisoli]
MWPTQLLTLAAIISNNAAPGVAVHFRTTQIVWFTLITSVVATPLLPFVMKLGDRYGKRRVMLVMVGLGVVGDVLAAVAGNYGLLILGRGIAGFYGVFAALSFPAVRDLFPSRLVRQATSLLGASMGVIALAGPFLAGRLITGLSFRPALWFIAIGTAVAFVMVLALVPETPRHDLESGFDWVGAIALSAGLAALVYALGQGQSWGWGSGKTVGWIAGAVVLLVAFAFVERSAGHPILDPRLISRRPVAVAVTVAAIGQAAALMMASFTVLLAVYPHIPGVSDGLGWSSMHNAQLGLSWNLCMILAGYLAGRLLRHSTPRLLWLTGLALATAGFGLMGAWHHTAPQLVLTQCLAQIGMGIVVATGPVLILGSVSVREQGQASGAFQMLTYVFMSLISAVGFAILTAHSKVVQGTAFYLDAGYRLVLLGGAAILLVTLLVSLLAPSRTAQETDAAAEPASAGPVGEAGEALA